MTRESEGGEEEEEEEEEKGEGRGGKEGGKRRREEGKEGEEGRLSFFFLIDAITLTSLSPVEKPVLTPGLKQVKTGLKQG